MTSTGDDVVRTDGGIGEEVESLRDPLPFPCGVALDREVGRGSGIAQAAAPTPTDGDDGPILKLAAGTGDGCLELFPTLCLDADAAVGNGVVCAAVLGGFGIRGSLKGLSFPRT
jgi:hypothetical protein